jgi:hypothetical protein
MKFSDVILAAIRANRQAGLPIKGDDVMKPKLLR